MVELKFTGFCEGCKCSELELYKIETLGEGTAWSVRCRHRQACILARQHLVKEMDAKTKEQEKTHFQSMLDAMTQTAERINAARHARETENEI